MKLPTGRQVIAFILIAFALYAVLTAPDSAAEATAGAWDHLKDGFEAVSTFFDGLLNS